ncbi:hypothetical protein EJC47_18440 [Sphingomonas sp. TF3]|uniref:hypothetical protein n=1 Tax=Sphingomonas sp. TF3 TaxID=2495580 RepID=UPI000F8703E9|nr:hypothetical protein [Sphingomonas sp. TF3]RUN75052.1 hypothetical protein EJC47_18440 [Sphingomonas sp. TF3]
MPSETPLEISLLAEDEDVATELGALSDDAFVQGSAGFDGLDQIMVTFTTVGLPLVAAITKIVLAQIDARKHVKLRYGKLVVEGVSETKVAELLDVLQRDAAR